MAEHLFDYLILPEPITVDIAAGSGPDIEPKTPDDFLAGIASVRSRLRQIEFCEVFANPDSLIVLDEERARAS